VKKKPIERSIGPVRYSIILTVLLGAALLMVVYIKRSQERMQDQQIIVSYDQDAIDGKVPMPVTPDAVRVIRQERGAPPTMVDVILKSGETNRFHLISPEGNSGTNWHFSKPM